MHLPVVLCLFVLARTGRHPNMSLLATPLDFVFKGYSIWLELEQVESDLDKAVDAAALDLDVHAIPGTLTGVFVRTLCGVGVKISNHRLLFPLLAPHVTVIYGISHLSEDECLKRFREDLATRLQAWQDLRVKGLKVWCCVFAAMDAPRFLILFLLSSFVL
jgi:hypothetical protein